MSTPKPFELVTTLSTLSEALDTAHNASRLRDRDQLTPLARMAADVPGMKAADYSTERRGTVHWCDTHEVEVNACHKRGRDCRGVPLSGPSDPTGEAAVVTTQGMISLRVIDNACQVIATAVQEILGELRAWQLIPEDKARTMTDGQDEDENAVWCECCARAGKKVPPHGQSPRTCNGRLEQAMWLCGWCEKWVQRTGSAPSLMVSEAHCSGAKVRAFVRGDVIEAKTTTGTLVDRFPAKLSTGTQVA